MVLIDVKSKQTLKLVFNYNAQLVNITKKIPSRRWNGVAKQWEIPVADLKIAKQIYSDNGITYTVSDKAKSYYAELEKTKQAMAEKIAIKEIDYDVRSLDYKLKPLQHQFVAIERVLQSNNLLLADDMGLGKTFVSINTAVIRKRLTGANKCLILCGINSVKYNWKKEIEFFSDEQGTVFEGKNMAERLQQLEDWVNNIDTNYFGIINIESLQKKEFVDILAKACKQDIISMVVIDEIHKCKNHGSLRGKAIHKLQPKYKLGLTGTPIMNRVDECWNILKWLDLDVGTYSNFRNQYCVFGGFQDRQVVAYKNLDELHARISKVMLRRKKEDVLDLPDKLYTTEFVELDKKSKKLYNDIRQELLQKIDEIQLDSNPLSKLLRLRQVTGGLLGEGKEKVDRLLELLEEAKEGSRKVIVFTQWKQQVDAVVERLRKDGYNPYVIDGTVDVKTRQEIVNSYQASSNFEVIVGTIGAMGTGLTLNTAEIVIFLDKAWTPADNRQAEDRAYRIGTKHTVNIVSLVAQDTIDEYIENILNEKGDLFTQVVEGKLPKKTARAKLIEQILGRELK